MKLRPTTTSKNSLRGKLPSTCLATMFIIKITLHMLKFLSVRCFLNLLQLHLIVPFPFLLQHIYRDFVILPLCIASSSDMTQLFQQPLCIPISPGIVHLTSVCQLFFPQNLFNTCDPVVKQRRDGAGVEATLMSMLYPAD